jgi:hypothetical protein
MAGNAPALVGSPASRRRNAADPLTGAAPGGRATYGEGHGPARSGGRRHRHEQEALTNIRKHATAAAVDVCLAWSADQVALSVRDDGAGTGTSSAVARDTTDTTPGWGLAGMAERAGSIGAELQAGPTDRGFQVRMTLPLTPRVAEGTP